MNFMVYPIGMLGLLDLRLRRSRWAASAAVADPRRHRRSLNRRIRDHALRQDVRVCSARRASSSSGDAYDVGVFALFLFQMVFMDTAVDDPDRRDGRALEVLVVPDLRLLHVDVRLPALRQLGLGRRLARRPRRRTSASATATSTSPARRSCTWSAAWRPSPAPSCIGPRIGKFTKDGKPDRHPRPPHPDGHRWARSSWPSAGSASTPARRWPARDLRIGVDGASTRCSPARRARSPPCSMMWSRSASPTRA